MKYIPIIATIVDMLIPIFFRKTLSNAIVNIFNNDETVRTFFLKSYISFTHPMKLYNLLESDTRFVYFQVESFWILQFQTTTYFTLTVLNNIH